MPETFACLIAGVTIKRLWILWKIVYLAQFEFYLAFLSGLQKQIEILEAIRTDTKDFSSKVSVYLSIISTRLEKPKNFF